MSFLRRNISLAVNSNLVKLEITKLNCNKAIGNTMYNTINCTFKNLFPSTRTNEQFLYFNFLIIYNKFFCVVFLLLFFFFVVVVFVAFVFKASLKMMQMKASACDSAAYQNLLYVLPSYYTYIPSTKGDTRWRSWLRHCATSRKVVGSIPDGFIGFFHWRNPSSRTMPLGLTQPLTEMSTKNVSWG